MEINFSEKEKKILKFWQENEIFKKSVEQRQNRPDFVFYEGPPTANGRPGIHHVLSRVFKDIICRYKTMQGFKVQRKAGWDTHGLPVELAVEKKLGLKNKKEIEQFGIAKFNNLCRQSVWEYKKDWEKLTERIGFWVDMKHPYITYESNYIESVWRIIKNIFQKDLVYKDYKVVPYCPRCGTSLSSHEVALGYRKVKENSIYVKFPLKSQKNAYLLVWTTTPWTLPANVAVAVDRNLEYSFLQAVYSDSEIIKQGDIYIVAKERATSIFYGTGRPHIEEDGILRHHFRFDNDKSVVLTETKVSKGKDLLKLEYEPVFGFTKPEKKAYFVVAGDFVSSEEGTGLVHIAPAFGEDDMAVGKANNLPVLMTVNDAGRFKSEIKPWAGMFVKEADPLIIENLKKRNLLFKEEIYEHDYPFCWRCGSPLIYYAKESWFINMQAVKDDLIKNNQKINWIPSHLKEGRFGGWLEEIKDWAFSRERYWGTPLAVWHCQSCKKREVIGSVADLASQNFSTNNYFITRHGDSMRQVKKVAMCWPEKKPAPLTAKGKLQVKKTATILKSKKIDLIFSSDLLRTKQTAEIISKELGAKVVFDKRLREYNVGIFNYKDTKLPWFYLNKKKDILATRLPEGESLMDVAKRMYAFSKDINKKYGNKNILIVSHELPLTIFEGTLSGMPLAKILEIRRWEREKNIKTGGWKQVKFSDLPYTDKMELDLHRPAIDEIKFYCSDCQGLMTRTPEVIDVWFDSGSMPFAQFHWPFDPDTSNRKNNQKTGPPELFPADYISEAIDQTRGWFYTLLAISTLLGFGSPYKNVISLGHILDEKGEKMSKSKGNIVEPDSVIEKYGVDAVRWYFYTINQPGESKLFAEKDIDAVLKKFILILWNCCVFFETYALKKNRKQKSKNILDKWIVSQTNSLIQEVTRRLDNYDVTAAARALERFTIEELSQWYVRRSRKRFQKPETQKEIEEASSSLNYVLSNLIKMTAPFIPFLSEDIHFCLGTKRLTSVHLDDWPVFDKNLVDGRLNEQMQKTREIVTAVLAERAKSNIKVRQPLAKLSLNPKPGRLEKDLLELIKEEVNVKEIIFDDNIKGMIKLDKEITPQLKEEGMVREIIRNVQEMRRSAFLTPKDKISVMYSGPPDFNRILERYRPFIFKEGRIKSLVFGGDSKQFLKLKKEIKVGEQKIWLAIKKL